VNFNFLERKSRIERAVSMEVIVADNFSVRCWLARLIDFANAYLGEFGRTMVRAHVNLRAFANALDSLYAAPQSRAGADGLPESTRQMALIRKSARAGNLRESFVGGQEQVLGPFDAPLKEPTVWGVTG
jgi:hypothetical protein